LDDKQTDDQKIEAKKMPTDRNNPTDKKFKKIFFLYPLGCFPPTGGLGK
jgi:hypothetical protein